MQSVTTSAPGKLMFFGDHAVVYNHPCIVTAVDHRMKVQLFLTDDSQLTLNAPDVEIMRYQKSIDQLGQGDMPKGAQFVEVAVRNFSAKFNTSQGVNITSTSEFSSEFGFGSSSAVTVATIRALSEIFERPMTEKELFDLSYKTVLDIQKKGSGFDVAAAVYGGTLYFLTAGEIIEKLAVENLPLIVGYTGVKADTTTLITQVQKTADEYPIVVEGVFGLIEELVNEAKAAIGSQDFEKLGKLMNMNQGLLETLGVSTEKLSQLNYSALNAGAYGAKLSGAGGGDCMIACSPDDQRAKVIDAIVQVGGTNIEVSTNAPGVRVE
ncbi:mevalonate kinase [Candidatus Roizmanbacteria bacterium CG_4_10_14_0_2_um_filter_39_13]|uniref:Mevalonate kinase n=1 Tax=Candidatus Roizmanbacteria bacterium CG_4_10_14_0_2_um_filter_39_13 TaxID=1974825 RepID=A0A2M7TYU3_9BACT|nr:MAG: mevalonate kinase [Candidatus Roizmanbacteria bacterium CG_4_10_14_0_2_um_filter_39_13]